MAVVDELVTIIGIKVAADTFSKLQSFRESVNSAMKPIADFSVVVMGFSGVAASFVKGVMDEAAELDTLAAKTGISTTALQEWSYVAQKSGLNAQAIQGDLASLQKTMSSPIPGQYNQTLAMFGVSARKSNGELKTTDELLLDMSDRLKGMSHQRAAQWASKLGISDDTLLLLRQGRDGLEELRKEAHKLGGIIPEDAIKTASKTKQQLAEVQFVLKGITSQVALATLPALSSLLEVFKDFLQTNREWIQIGLSALMEGLVAGFERFFSVIKKIVSQFSPLTDKLTDFLPEMDAVEVVIHLVTGALTGLLFILGPILAKLAVAGALVTAAAIAFEDLFTYLEGGESVIGSLFDEFEKRWPELASAIKVLGRLLYDFLIRRLEYVWGAVKKLNTASLELWKTLLDNLNAIAGPLADFFKNFDEKFPALSRLLSKFVDFVNRELAAAFDLVVKGIKKVIDVIFEILGVLGKAVERVSGALDWAARKMGLSTPEEEEEYKRREKAQEAAVVTQAAQEGYSYAFGLEQSSDQGEEIKPWGYDQELDQSLDQASPIAQWGGMQESWDAGVATWGNTSPKVEKKESTHKDTADKTEAKAKVTGSMATYTMKPPTNSTTSNQYIDNRNVAIQVAGSDPMQTAEYVFEKFTEYNVNAPGQYASVAQ